MGPATRAPLTPRITEVMDDQRADLYRQIVESAHEGIWVHDLAGRTTFANAQMASLLGYTVAELSSLSIFDLLDGPGQQQAQEMLERERAAPLTEQVDCCYRRKDGSPVWCLVSRSPLLDGEGRHIGSINLVSDITERKQLDEKLRRNSDLLAEAQRVAHLGSWGWDVVNDLIDWSDEMYVMLGLPIDGVQLTFQSYLDSVHPDDRDRVIAYVNGGVNGNPTFTYECRVVKPGGEIVWIHAEGETITDATGVVRHMRGTMLNITAYKEAVIEVERTSARYQLLQRMATEANKDSGFETVLRLALEQILRHTQWPVGRVFLVTGAPPKLALTHLSPHPPALESAESNPLQDEGDEVPATLLTTRVLESARPVWLASLTVEDRSRTDPTPGAAPLKSGFAFPVLVNGDIVAVLEFLSDRTASVDGDLLETCEQVGTQLARVVQRQRAADDLAAARDSAMESVRVKSEFLATMSHEIRTPMNGVIGLTHLLLDTQLDERQRQFAEGVQVSGEALLAVINDILDFSKLEAGKVELDYEDFEVRRVIEEVADLLGPAAYGKGLELLAYCLPDVPAVLVGDSGRIRQILLNLVSNGVKFSAAGEVVTRVTCAPLEPGKVTLRVEVTDTGIGIPEDSRARLFESFSQADASTTRQYGGTGLGLAISQRLVEAMDGRIGFDSEIDCGSTFWFEVPLPVGTTQAKPRAPLPGLMTGLRALVVDDNATNRMILESQLQSWRLRPDLVDSAAAALVQLRAMASRGEPYPIAVLDMCMPGTDGLELARQISADSTLADTRLIMLTSTTQQDPRVLAAAGVSDWLSKPVRSSDLYDRLLRLMAPQQLPSALPPDAPAAAAVAPTQGHVLIVEDNPLNQLVAEGIVISLGFSVDIVANGAEALRAILHTSYAAVLMDCHMPVLDGFETTREIRRREGQGAHVPIIAMTAGAMAEDRERCAAAGMDDFISKPVTVAGVADVLTRQITTVSNPAPLLTEVPAEDGVRPAWADEPVLDLNRIAQLRQLGSMGGTDLLGRVVKMFTRDGTATVAALREAVSAGSTADLGQAAHKLRGTSANMGANRVAAICRLLEEDTLEIGATVNARVDALECELANAVRAIEQATKPHAP